MTSTIAGLPPDVAEALAREKAYLESRPRGGKGGRDFDFDNLPAPEKQGQSIEHHRLFLPTKLPMQGLPWKAIPNHQVMAQGASTSLTCPTAYARANDPDGKMGPPPPCAICEAADFVKEQAKSYPRGSKENDETWAKGVRLGSRERFFSNTVDLDNLARHWKQNEQGATDIIPTITAYGKELRDGLVAVMGECGMFWNVQAFTRLKITAAKTGPHEMNVDRDVRLTMPIQQFFLPADHAAIITVMLGNLNDLDSLVKLVPYDQQKSFIPSYARPNVQVTVPATIAAATPQAMPPPIPAVPGIPQVPVVAQAPAIPSIPQVPVVAAPTMPTIPSIPQVPQVPVATAPQIPNIPSIPSIPQAPVAAAPSMPQIPNIPSMPAVPMMPGVPSVPSMAASSLPPASSPPSMPPIPPLPPPPKIG